MLVTSMPGTPNACLDSRFEKGLAPKNTLLASLPAEELDRLAPYLQITDLEFKQVLVEF